MDQAGIARHQGVEGRLMAIPEPSGEEFSVGWTVFRHVQESSVRQGHGTDKKFRSFVEEPRAPSGCFCAEAVVGEGSAGAASLPVSPVKTGKFTGEHLPDARKVAAEKVVADLAHRGAQGHRSGCVMHGAAKIRTWRSCRSTATKPGGSGEKEKGIRQICRSVPEQPINRG